MLGLHVVSKALDRQIKCASGVLIAKELKMGWVEVKVVRRTESSRYSDDETRAKFLGEVDL